MQKNILYLFIFIIFISNNIYAEIQNKILIQGNENIDDEIIFSIIENKVTDYSSDNLNEIIKTLYDTGNFKSVEVEKKDDKIILKIEENPSINKIDFIGNQRFKKDEILEIFQKEKYFQTFNQYTINNFIYELKNLYSSFGYNIVEINYTILNDDKDSNFVNLQFDINEGDISKINRIYFVGNESFSDSKLRSIIKTKQRNVLRLSRASNFKNFQIQEDERSLINFYRVAGFKEINIDVQKEFIKEKNKLNIYFYIIEGDQYLFRNIDINLEQLTIDKDISEKIINDELLNLSKIINKNNYYNPEIFDNSKERLSEALYMNGKFFYKIQLLEKKDDLNVDVLIEISDVLPKYVNTINIYGNTRTKEKVLRREITFAEGDPFNELELGKTNKNLQKLNFFKRIDIKDKEIDNQVDIDIEVEEKPTGEFQIGVGLDSYEGATFITGLKEKNIFGDGRELNLNVNTSADNTIYSFGVVEPYVFNKDIDLIYDISYSFKDRSDSKSYDLTQFDTNAGFRYALADKISHSIILQYLLKDYEITNTSASDSIQRLGGNNADILLDNIFNYNNLDSFIRPSKGSNLKYLNTISPATNDDNGYIKNLITYSKYYSFKKKNIISIRSKIGNIFSLQDKELPIEDKFSLGGRWLRGFDRFGVGPRESRKSYMGAKNVIAAKIDYNRPIYGTSDNPIDLNLFTDAGTLFDNKIDPSFSEESVRASYGFGINFYSPIGPIGFSWGFPLLKEDHDIEKMFTFSIGLTN